MNAITMSGKDASGKIAKSEGGAAEKSVVSDAFLAFCGVRVCVSDKRSVLDRPLSDSCLNDRLWNFYSL